MLFQTEKHDEIVNKISHLTNCLNAAQQSVKEMESNEDSLDVFMSSLNRFTLSKSDMTKMKVELQNLRKEEVKLVKLINLAKPANLPPLVIPVSKEDEMRQFCERIGRSLEENRERRRKLFKTNVSDHSVIYRL